MLVLTRKVRESITIGNDIVVTVLEIRGSQIRIGVEAPKQTPVNRTEIYESIVEQNVKASEAPVDLAALARTPRAK